MGTVDSTLSNLLSLLGQSSSTGTSSADITQSLANALEGDSSDASTDPGAFLLDLSPQAQQALSSGSSSNPLSATQSFTLSTAQQSQITSIIAKYKDAPYDQDTFNQIVSDLTVAGLGPNQLAQQDQVQSFNPTMVFLNALNGLPPTQGMPTSSDEQTKAQNYLQGIESQWQAISTTYSSAVSSSSNS